MKTPRQKAEPVEDLRGKILKTPKQKVEQQECLTGVKRIMKTPKQKAEPVEDLRGKILKTPKQKLEPQDCLTGVKRIFSTPQQETKPLEDLQEKLLETPKALEARDASSDDVKENEETPALKQESEDLSVMMDVKNSPLPCLTDIERKLKTSGEKGTPVDDLIGMKRLRKTPREKTKPVEENFGIKRLMKSPRPRVNEPVEDFEGLKELMEEPMPNPTGQLESNEVEDQTLDCGIDAVKELDFTHEEPQNNVPSDVIDNVGIEKEAIKEVAVDDHLGQVPCEHESSNASEPVEETKVNAADANLSKERPQVENTTDKVSEIESAFVSEHDKKAVPGTKVVETESAEDKQNAPEHSEDAVIPVSVRGRRGKKTEATAPPAVRQTTRRRNAKTAESIDFEVAMEKSASLFPKVALKPKRGRNLKKASDVQVEMVQGVPAETERVREPATEPSPSGDVGQEENNNAAHLEHAVVKPKRGRKAKQPDQLVPEQVDVPCSHSDDLLQTDEAKDSNKLCSDQLVVGPSSSEKKSSNAVETAPQTSVTHSLNEGEAGIQEITKMGTAIVQKKSVRGRRAKVVESKSPEDKREVTQHSEDPVLASVRGRRGKKTEAAVPPVRQTMRSRNVKSQPSTPDQPEIILEKDVQTELVTEITTSPINAHQEQNDCAPNAEDVIVKPSRGRKTKQTPVQPPQPKPEKKEFVSEEHLTEDTLPQKSIPTLGKPRRGRTTKMNIAEQNEVSEETVVAVEINQQPEPPVRAKRGRKAKQEEEKMENNGKDNSVDTTKSQDPIKSRSRTAEQDCVDPRVQTSEIIVPEETEAPLAEPLKMMEQANVTAKPRRGGRRAKQDTKSETLVKSSEVQEIPANSSTDKPQQSRRGQRVADKVEVTSVLKEEKTDSEAEEKKNSEPDAPASKPTRGRRAKNDVSLAIPAKRARRGAVLPLVETNADSADLVTELASTSVQPPKRGRRAATKPTADDVTVAIDQATPTEDFQSIAEDTKMSKRSVKWKTGIEVFEIQKLTPVKAVRGRKSKIGDQVDTERPIVSKDASKTEEMDLSDKVVGAQPAKRARRGAKLADVTADKDESTSKGKNVEAETRPQTRRGRSAKK